MKKKLFIVLPVAFLLFSCSLSDLKFWEKNKKPVEQQTNEPEPQPEPEPEPPVFNVDDFYGGYYSSIKSWENGEDLKTQLHNLISSGNYTPLPYDYEPNIKADHTMYDLEYLDVLYDEKDVFKDSTNTGWQREHCFPASLMCGSTTADATGFLGRATDYHNLWAANSNANSSRGNKNYGNANKLSEKYQDRTTKNGMDGYSFDDKNFEPGDKDKGITARSIFYMATMYTDDVMDTKNNVLMKGLKIQEQYVYYSKDSVCEFAIGGLSSLLEWNKRPVSDLEAQHNESVYSHVLSKVEQAQGNRNPYIDYPELVDFVFGNKSNQAGCFENLTPSIYTLQRDREGLHNYAVETAKRSYKYGETFAEIDYKVCAINNSFSYTTVEETNCPLIGHTFGADDGVSKEITVYVGDEAVKYTVSLDKSGECNFSEPISKDCFNKTTVNTNMNATIGTLSVTTYVKASSGYTLTADNTRGEPGIKLGSSSNSVEKIVIQTTSEITIDAMYISACAGNTSSNYTLTVTIGTEKIVYSKVAYNKDARNLYGKNLASAKTGILKIEFEGSNAVCLGNLSLNIK